MTRKKLTRLILIFQLLVSLCYGQKAPAYLNKIESKKEFDLLKGEPLSKNFNGVECVKVVYSITSKKIYYIESKRYRWHHVFVQEILNDQQDLEQFNSRNYSSGNDRDYILATFNYNVNTKNYFLQFAACDDPNDEMISILVEKVKQTFFKQDQFKLLLNSTVLLRRKKELQKNYQTLTSDELFKNQNYQSIYAGKTTGILKFISADSLRKNKDYSSFILILNGTSNQLPVCKAVVTNEFQTPLSHICLLTASRKTPCAAQKNIFTNDSIRKYDNQMVEITVGKDRIKIIRASAETNKTIKNVRKKNLEADTVNKLMADLLKLSYKSKKSYGSKVCNLAELKKIKYKKVGLVTPAKAFGIPFFYYAEHIRQSKTNLLVSALLNDTALLKNDSLVDLELKKIRSSIKKWPLEKAMAAAINAMCLERFGKIKIRFRSSSNCEDESGFNGAGLYTSETGNLNDSLKSVEAAIKKVWASLWTLRAFKERTFFNINHATVFMAVLVHPAVDDEILNGVAVTKNLYRSYDFGFVINMQKGEEEVVSPKPGITCEQVVSYMNNSYASFYNKTRAADWICFSSLSNDNSLLTGDELMDLTLQLEAIKKHFYEVYRLWNKTEYKDFGMDVEFKLIERIDKKRIFLFKQARPYNN
ncbi:MAG: hypothetical protein H0W61_01980 [Bacteroidetes bacterium]|nr:hypothetical protein [Bacteroidota bacterium]